ncbi:conserved domain protein [Streptococcus infantis SK970]|nr:conserved domain protein [Streptococcus infantis SK970]
MKNKVGFLVLFGSMLLLTACSGKAEKTELTSQTSEVSTTSTTEIELKPESQYASIIEKFEKLTTNGNDSLKSAVEGTEAEETMVMNYIAQIKENGHTKNMLFTTLTMIKPRNF